MSKNELRSGGEHGSAILRMAAAELVGAEQESAIRKPLTIRRFFRIMAFVKDYEKDSIFS